MNEGLPLDLLRDLFLRALKDVENPTKRELLIYEWNEACERLNKILTYKSKKGDTEK